jgi:hypothetical protein
VVKLADARDSKSRDLYGREGSTPSSGTKIVRQFDAVQLRSPVRTPGNRLTVPAIVPVVRETEKLAMDTLDGCRAKVNRARGLLKHLRRLTVMHTMNDSFTLSQELVPETGEVRFMACDQGNGAPLLNSHGWPARSLISFVPRSITAALSVSRSG